MVSRMRFSECIEAHYLDTGHLESLPRNAVLRIPLKRKKKIGRANFHFYSGHR